MAALKAGNNESELHRTYDNLTAAYSTEVSTFVIYFKFYFNSMTDCPSISCRLSASQKKSFSPSSLVV